MLSLLATIAFPITKGFKILHKLYLTKMLGMEYNISHNKTVLDVKFCEGEPLVGSL